MTDRHSGAQAKHGAQLRTWESIVPSKMSGETDSGSGALSKFNINFVAAHPE
jgi:hypothetical protein